jgi:5-methylcytosine-specific restriction endonuclease McrA
MSARKRVSTRAFQKRRDEFFEQGQRENAPCWLCGQPIDYSAKPGSTDDSHELDHYVPVSVDPTLQYDPANFRHAHKICNVLRSNKPPKLSLGIHSRQWY